MIKPILFNTEMVRTIQNGTKIATRRPIKDMDIINGWDCEEDGTPIAFVDQATGDSFPPTMPCHYQPGDILYVRETWAESADGYVYRADNTDSDGWGWRPSIHMPREAARIFLLVTGVRAERLQNMQPYDVAFEGFRRERDFKIFWDRTIKKVDLPLYGWAANPWVWVIEFERIDKEVALRAT